MRLFFKTILIFLILYLFSMAFFYFFQERLIFQNEKLAPDYKFSFEQKFEEINLQTADNNTINALLFKADNPKGVLLYFHGNRGSLVRWGEISSYFTRFDLDIFVMDYRSYGKSTGEFNENQMYNDAQICYNYLKEKYPENSISIYGRSLGCTFAVRTAVNNNPKQLILEAPFYNLTDAVRYHYPLLPFKFLLKYKFNTNEYIARIPCKTTIFHGTKDDVVPFSSGKKLFNSSNLSQTSLIKIEEGTHHNLFEFSKYQNKLLVLFKND